MCGLPPYTADRLIDVWVIDDGAVEIRLAEYFERPLRLTPAEGVALLAAGARAARGAGSRDGGAARDARSPSSSDAVGASGLRGRRRRRDHLEPLADAVDDRESARDRLLLVRRATR